MLKVYLYKNCSTCKNAKKWLESHGIPFEEKAIRESPPSEAELKTAIAELGLVRVFNTSGADYRALNIKDRLPQMMAAEVLELLASNGNLVKRPFLIGNGVVLTGFKADEWEKRLLS